MRKQTDCTASDTLRIFPMIWQSIKNYFINLKFYFIPLGTLFLGLIIGFSIALPGLYGTLQDTVGGLTALVTGVETDAGAFFDSLYLSVRSLNWGEPLTAVKSLFDGAWLKETFYQAAQALFLNKLPDYADQITLIYQTLVSDVKFYFIIVLTWAILGIFVGSIITKLFVRKTIASRNFGKFLLVSIVDSLLSTTIVAFCIWMITVWLPGGLISLFALLILSAFVDLFEAHLVHGLGKIKLKEVVNAKNCALLLLSNLFVILIALALVVAVCMLTNVLAGIVIGLPFLEIAFLVIKLNAEAYVKTRIGE